MHSAPGQGDLPHITGHSLALSGFSVLPVLPSEVVEGVLAPAAFEGVATPAAIKGAPTAISGDCSSDCVVEVDALGSDLSVTTEVDTLVWLEALRVANSTRASRRASMSASLSTSVEGRHSFALDKVSSFSLYR